VTYLELVQRLRSETGIAGSGPTSIATATYDLARLAVWVNMAYKDIVMKWKDWKFLWDTATFNTVASQSDYAVGVTNQLPADLKMLDEVTVRIGTDLQQMEYVPFRDYRKDQQSWGTTAVETPAFFTVLPNNSIRLLPAPTGVKAIAFDYYVKAPDLALDTDEPLIPEDYHDIIIHRAKMFWAQFEESPFELQGAQSEFDLAMKQLEADYGPSTNFEHARARGGDIVVRAE
jgi:hypothetical protein